MINYEAVWRVLANLITELQKTGEVMPSDVMKDLRSAKTMMQILKADKDNPNHLTRVEAFLSSVESYAIYTAQKSFGAKKVDDWMTLLKKARSEVQEEAQHISRFVSGVPRDKHWVRIKVTEDTPLWKIEQVAEEENLEYKPPEDEYVIVYGERSGIQNFIKRMADLRRD